MRSAKRRNTANGSQAGCSRRNASSSGRDFRVRGLNDPRLWYTNVDLNRTEESLVTIMGGKGDTRCGGVIPPSKPPDHDYRQQWDLTINGNIRLRGEADSWGGNVVKDPSSLRDLSFSFPVRVYSWFPYDESLDDSYININSLYIDIDTFITVTSAGWILTPEANATEYFITGNSLPC